MKIGLPLLALSLMVSACQQKVPQRDAAVKPPAGGPPPMGGDPSKNPDMAGLVREVDADGNGQLSRAEWEGKGLPVSSFNMFEKGRGFVTLKDYQTNAAPPGIDLNGDGKLTVQEFKEFDKQMSAKMGAGGPPPPKP